MRKNFILMLVVLTLSAIASAQTKTVAKSGTPDFSTVQAAIDFFATDPDPGTPNVINITDSSVYDEMITINVPLTLQGTGVSRPILAIRMNSAGDANDGLLIRIPTGTTNDVTLKNLIVIPSKTSTPTDDGIRSHGQNLNILFDNILVTQNNGSDAPVTTTGLAPVSLTGATQFGDDGAFIGGDTTITGTGVTLTMKNTVITHIQGAVPNLNNDGLVLSGATNVFRIQDGCVFSYCNRLGIQAAGDFQISAPNNRVFVLGNKGFAGIWFAALPDASVTNPRIVDGCNVVFNLGENHATAPVGAWGIEIQNGGTVNYIVRNSIIAGNTDRGLLISALTGTGSVTVENVTIANNGTQAIEVVAGYTSAISITDSILAGNGTSNVTNVITHNGGGTMDISYSAIVTSGVSAFVTPPTTGSGVINMSNVVNADPLFADTTTFTSTSFFDVLENAYAHASSTGNGLGGGADFVGSPLPLSARNWNIYE